MIPWRDAWQEALYGPAGFYRRPEGPAGHFTTSTHSPFGGVFAEAVAAVADREGVCRVLDIGCGRGELLAHLHARRPDLQLVGVDVVDRPADLPEPIGWLRSFPETSGGMPEGLRQLEGVLVIAHEWLDVVPCTVAEVGEDGTLVEVLVDAQTGEESPGGFLRGTDADWVRDWWPLDDAEPGDRVEVGAARDHAWDDLVSRVRSGVVLAVDYGHLRATRPPTGTLTAYRGGTLVPAVPDGSCDITAHVAVDSLAHDELQTQRDALRLLGLSGARPERSLARSDPAAYLAALAGASTVAALADPQGLGGFWWVLRRVAAPS